MNLKNENFKIKRERERESYDNMTEWITLMERIGVAIKH